MSSFSGRYQRAGLSAWAFLSADSEELIQVYGIYYLQFPFVRWFISYHGAAYAVTESVARIVATGGDYRKIHFTFCLFLHRPLPWKSLSRKSRHKHFPQSHADTKKPGAPW